MDVSLKERLALDIKCFSMLRGSCLPRITNLTVGLLKENEEAGESATPPNQPVGLGCVRVRGPTVHKQRKPRAWWVSCLPPSWAQMIVFMPSGRDLPYGKEGQVGDEIPANNPLTHLLCKQAQLNSQEFSKLLFGESVPCFAFGTMGSGGAMPDAYLRGGF